MGNKPGPSTSRVGGETQGQNAAQLLASLRIQRADLRSEFDNLSIRHPDFTSRAAELDFELDQLQDAIVALENESSTSLDQESPLDQQNDDDSRLWATHEGEDVEVSLFGQPQPRAAPEPFSAPGFDVQYETDRANRPFTMPETSQKRPSVLPYPRPGKSASNIAGPGEGGPKNWTATDTTDLDSILRPLNTAQRAQSMRGRFSRIMRLSFPDQVRNLRTGTSAVENPLILQFNNERAYTVLVTNIPQGVELFQLVDEISGGTIRSATMFPTAKYLQNTRPPFTTNSAHIIFLEYGAASRYVDWRRQHPLRLRSSTPGMAEATGPVVFRLLNRFTRPIEKTIQNMLDNGRSITRVLVIEDNGRFLAEDLLIKMGYTHSSDGQQTMLHLPLKRGRTKEGMLVFEYSSLHEAYMAQKSLAILLNAVGNLPKAFFVDPCSRGLGEPLLPMSQWSWVESATDAEPDLISWN